MRVDAHCHLWDLDRRAQPWMNGPWADPIARTFRPAELASQLDAHGIDATVVVQACSSYDETRELLELAQDGGPARIAGVVGWADLTDPALADTVGALRAGAGGERLSGIRHQVQDEPDPDWLGRPEVRRALADIARAGLAYDLLVTPRELPAALAAVDALPQLSFVVDHAAKPPIARGQWQPWADGISDLARRPNTTCKLSGLVTEADWHAWKPDEILPYTRHVLDAFGPERVMAGSDWPVCTLAGSYGEVAALTARALGHLDAAEHDAVRGGTAIRVYRLAAPGLTR